MVPDAFFAQKLAVRSSPINFLHVFHHKSDVTIANFLAITRTEKEGEERRKMDLLEEMPTGIQFEESIFVKLYVFRHFLNIY